ncbi:MAG: aminopeptidase [Candidatus Eisenbacteria sp.]|nr:aminopeptidase [Candidatus Eisenbacteria bacterium]
MPSLEDAAGIAVEKCMGLKSGETCLVITDEPCREVGYALWEAARWLRSEATLLEIIPRDRNGQEPPPGVAEFMRTFDVILCPTSMSLTHTQARKNACNSGARIATLPGVTVDMMERTLNADYDGIRRRSEKMAGILTAGSEAHLTTPGGTDLRFLIRGREGYADTGIVHKRGESTNLPAGEAYLAPLEGETEGTLVIDGAMAGVGVIRSEPIRVTVKEGYAVELAGGEAARKLEELIKPLGKPARNIAELGIGANEKAILTGNILEDEKVIGTVHVAIGDNKSMGGTVSVESHLDGILLKPTLLIDGNAVMRDGEIVV